MTALPGGTRSTCYEEGPGGVGGSHGAGESRLGYRRIQGAISNLEHKLARSTIADILRRRGMEPAPERSRKATWKDFLAQHWELIIAADFFTPEV
jgi:hypothetical protein